ncbi:MAG: NAD-glutamate dehydrogenase, partial [Kiloniellales bacterium]|nr:NAD-glutamate dehydrogenase [Kiloniellales bacterium]
MVGKSDKKSADLIADVCRVVRKGIRSKKTAAALASFTNRLYSNVPPDDLRGMTVETLAGAAGSLWALAGERQAGTAKVRVFNPRKETHGWGLGGHTVVEVVNDDMPFLVDSLTSAINRTGAEVHLVIHPVFLVNRNAKGKLIGLADETAARGATSESVMHIQMSEQTEEECAALALQLEKALADVRAAVEDWRSMRARARELVSELEDSPPKLPHAEVAEAIA